MFTAALVLAALASANALTPCLADTDCGTASYQVCCQNLATNSTGGLYGYCRDSRYEECCAHTVCNSYYQKCCNTTCCARSESCVSRATLDGDADQCSSIEHFDFRRGFITIGFPLLFGLGAIALGVIALIVLFATGVKVSVVVVSTIAVSVIIIVFSILMVISPLVFPMFYVASAASLAIVSLAASKPSQRPELVSAVTLAVVTSAFLVMINPFTSNSVLGAGPSYASVNGDGSPGGVLGAVLSYLAEYDQIVATGAVASYTGSIAGGGNLNVFSSCSAFYLGYFRNDPALYSDSRIHDQGLKAIPWGLCSRGYLTYQLFDAVLITVLLPVLIVLLVARLWEVRGQAVSAVSDSSSA